MNLGIIGVGNWGYRVAKESLILMEEGYIDKLYICDLDQKRLQAFPKKYTSLNYKDILNNVDAIHICTSNETHYSLGKMALEKNVHVLVEKPLTTNHLHAYDLLELALENGLVLQVGHIFRFANVINKLKELYEQRYFGEVYHITLEWTHLMQPMDNTNVLWDLLPHPLDILNFITKRWPAQLFATTNSIRVNKTELAFIVAKFKEKMSATINVSWINPIKKRNIEILGTENSAIVHAVNQTISIHNNEGEINKIQIEPNNTIRDELLNFIDSINNGNNSKNSGIIGLKTVELIESIKEL